MYLEKLEILYEFLKKGKMFHYVRGNDLSGEMKELYQTNHEKFMIEISPSSGYDYDEDNLLITFKESSNNDLFKLKFRNYYEFEDGNEDYGRKKNLRLYVNGSDVEDGKVVEQILEKVNFNNFLDQEIVKAKNSHQRIKDEKAKEQKEETLKIEQATQKLILKLDQLEQISSGDLKQFINLINNINENYSKNLFSRYEDKKDFLYNKPQVDYYHEQFGEFKIYYQRTHDYREHDVDKTNILIDNKNGIKFEIGFRHINSFDFERLNDGHLSLKIDDKIIYDKNIISQAISKTGIINYLETLNNKVKILKLAEYAQRSIDSSIREKINAIKAQDLLNKLSNNLVKSTEFSNMPIEINGSNVWLNKDLQLDRKDGPAVENFNGKDFWFKNGKAYLPDGNYGVTSENDTIHVNKGVSSLVSKFRNIFSSEDKPKKPKI